MADNSQRSLLIKDLENTKLRQRIKEFEAELYQSENKRIEEVSSLKKEFEAIKKQNEIDNKTKIRQLQLSNQKLMEDLVEAKRNQCRAEEEAVMASEKNCQLIYDLKNMQQDNKKYRTENEECSIESARKETVLQEAFEELKKFKQQNSKLQKELQDVSTYVQEAKVKLRRKEAELMELSNCLEESTEGMLQQETLEATIQKLKAEKSNLQLEIKETDANRNKMAEILLKNKELLAATKKLKSDNDTLVNENSSLETQLIHSKENIGKVKNALEAAQQEIFKLKESNARIEAELQESNFKMKDKEELLNQKVGLKEENLLLKTETDSNIAEIEKYKHSMMLLVEERCALKQRIEDLQESNFHKLKIIAKLKEVSSHPT